LRKKEKELKQQIDMMVSTKFQINPSTTADKNALKVIWGQTIYPTDHQTDGQSLL
jgi:hypothetical protein